MAGNDKKIIIICGKKWEDVTNKTCGILSYPLRDVIVCNGEVPNYASSSA